MNNVRNDYAVLESKRQNVGYLELRRFKRAVLNQLRKQGASKVAYKLVTDTLIANAIQDQHSPEDIAWALSQ